MLKIELQHAIHSTGSVPQFGGQSPLKIPFVIRIFSVKPLIGEF